MCDGLYLRRLRNILKGRLAADCDTLPFLMWYADTFRQLL